MNARPSPRVLKSHLPYQLVPPSFWKHNCKVVALGNVDESYTAEATLTGITVFSSQVIYVARNARDTLTSFYHFDHLVQFHPDPGLFEDYVQRFMKGDGEGERLH